MSAHVHLPESNSCPACEEQAPAEALFGRYYGRVKLRDGELPPGAGYGPALVDIVLHHHRPRWRNGRWQDIASSYSVRINGEHRTGGFASHLPGPDGHLDHLTAGFDLVPAPAVWVLSYEGGTVWGPFFPDSPDLAARRAQLAEEGAVPITFLGTEDEAVESVRLAAELDRIIAEEEEIEQVYGRIAELVDEYRPEDAEHEAVDHQYRLDNEDAADLCGLSGCELPRDHRGSCDDGVWRGVQVSVPAWVVEDLKNGRGLALDWVRGAVLRAIDGRS